MEYENVVVNSDRWFDLTDLLNEEWRPIKDYEGLYDVSNYGRVKSHHKLGTRSNTDTMLVQIATRAGYLKVKLSKFGKVKIVEVQRLVALTFIPNPNELPEVNHMDENKQNNLITNLCWMTSANNCNYGTRNKRISQKNGTPICQYNRSGQLLQTWVSVSDAAKNLGLQTSGICMCCQGKYKHSGGYIWRYAEK